MMKKIPKKLLGAILSAVIAFGVLTIMPITANAAGNSISNATYYSIGSTVNGSITDSNNKAFYKFNLPTSGRITIDVNAYIERTYYCIYDANGQEIWSINRGWNDTSKKLTMNETVDLTSGTYYFAVIQYYGTGNYNFKISFASANESFKETTGGTNNDISHPSSISLGNTYYGQIASNDDKDFYKFNLSTSGRITIDLNAYIRYTYYFIYDANGQEIWSIDRGWNDTSKKLTMNEAVDLTSGTYYFAVTQYRGTGNYNFKISFASANESFKETTGGTNNDISHPSSISVGNIYYGQIASNDDKDFYKFTVTGTSVVLLNINAKIYRTGFYIYDTDGNEVWEKTRRYWDDNSQLYTLSEKITLSSGTYYFAVVREYGTGNYNFSISSFVSPTSVRLSKSSLTLGVGESYSLNASVQPSNASQQVYWGTYSSYTASVSSYGRVKGQSTGTATVYAQTSNGKTATCKVTVKPAATKVYLNKSTLTLGVGESYQLSSWCADGTYSAKRGFGSSNNGIVYTSGSGKLTAKKPGTATITVKTFNGKAATCKVTVKPAATKVYLNKSTLTLGVGESYQLSSWCADGTYSAKRGFGSSNNGIVYTNGNGKLTAKKPGTATITVKTFNGKTATCKVTVKPAATRVYLNKSTLTLRVGESYQLSSWCADGTYSAKRGFGSSNNSIVYTSGNGKLTAKKPGTATITVKTFNGKAATCRVTVV